jgi:hypothetical protein
MHAADLETFASQEAIDFGNAELPNRTGAGNLVRERADGSVHFRARA